MGYALSIKHIFLSFAQQLFASNDFLTWNLDPTLTKIIIADEKFISNPLIESNPSIILKRSSLKWGMHSIDQRSDLSLTTGDKKFMDLLYGSLTYNVMYRKSQTAEILADYLFENLTGHRDQFRTKNINKITGLTMGEPITIKGPTEQDLVNVPIYVNFVYNKKIDLTQDLTDLSIRSSLLTGVTAENAKLGKRLSGKYNKGYYVEGFDYSISGQEINFSTVPSGVNLTFSYVGDITLNDYDETFDFPDGDILSYSLAELPRTYFSGLEHIEVYNDIFPEG